MAADWADRRRREGYVRGALAFVLAGGRGSRLMELTDDRAKPALFFGGDNRIIDFALSNAWNSGVARIAVATQYKEAALIRHLERAWAPDIDILPAAAHGPYDGTADAVRRNIDAIDALAPAHVLVLAGDHVYKMDYEPMLRGHAESGADVTLACQSVPRGAASDFGVMAADRDMRVRAFVEKPADPPALPADPDRALASMGVYAFAWPFLRALLLERGDARDFGRDLIPALVRAGGAAAHRFGLSCVKTGPDAPDYWRDIGAIDAYWQANIDLTDFTPELDLYDRRWPIRTYSPPAPPAKFVHDEDGRRGVAVSSMVSAGCIVSGARIVRSLLLAGCHVHSFAVLEGVVALPEVTVHRHARLRNAVVDRGVVVPDGLIVGDDPAADARWFRRTEGGVTLVTQPMVDRWAAASRGTAAR